MKWFFHPRVRNILYSLIIILPSVLTGNMYNVVNEQESTDILLANLSALSTSIYTGINDSQNHFSYSLTLLLSQSEFITFDLAGISQHINQFVYYNPTISNAYIIDPDGDVLFGINDTALSGSKHTAHVNRALEGTADYYSTFMNDEPFTQFAVPIYTINSPDSPEAALVMSYTYDPLEEELKALNSSSPNIHAYLIDINGRVIASSSNQSVLWSNRTLDIESIKRSIEYDASAPFTLFDEIPLVGIYYSVPDTNWTLLVTSSPPDAVGVSDIFSWLTGLLGAGGISSAEMLRKRRDGSIAIPDLPNI